MDTFQAERQEKRCGRCKKYKKLDKFYGDKIMKYKRRNECKICSTERERGYLEKHWPKKQISWKKYYQENRSKNLKRNKERRKQGGEKLKMREKDLRYKNRYGISYKEARSIWENQDRKCAICGIEIIYRNDNKRSSACLDHNHKTGKVRELLCNNCNNILCRSKENPFILIKCTKYLNKNN